MQLSENFSYDELTRTGIKELQIENREAAKHFENNLSRLAKWILQPLRDHLGVPVKVSSGFRSEELNKRIGGSKVSQHLSGQAADITASNMSAEELFNHIRNNLDLFQGRLGQVILERVKGKEWVHVSLVKNRKDFLGVATFYETRDGKNYQVV